MSNTPKHTPGPWRVDQKPLESRGGRNLFFHIQPPGFALYDDWRLGEAGIGHDQIDANLALVAAAPDLLEACKAAIITLDPMDNEHAGLHRVLSAAIGKAEGK